MPKRTDLRSILILGSGPIRIGQACEFDYSGAQACRVLRREGYRVVLVNSNPATIMTDPEWADATYLEPLDAETVAEVIERERPDAILPTLGGQTALNLAVELAPLGIELIGADLEAIHRAEDRELFRDDGARRRAADAAQHRRARARRRLPGARDRAAGVHARRHRRRRRLDAGASCATTIAHGLAASPVGQVLVEEYLAGWQEHELEVMCDARGNAVVVCSIENLDPMGVHTGDSWTIAPQQTLPDPVYQPLREAAFATARAVGVATGGANVQFAVHPATNEFRVIEMNPRVSRSSALASKATGFPIAKLAALLAVGYTLDELPNDITGKTTAAFEPALDYVAVKAPRFDFEKFPRADAPPRRRDARGRRGARARPDVRRGVPEGARGTRGAARGCSRPTTTSSSRARPSPLPSAGTCCSRRRGAGSTCRGSIRTSPTACGRSRPASGRARPGGRAGSRSTPAPASSRRGRRTTTSRTRATTRGRSRRAARSIVLGGGPNRIGQAIEFDYCCVHAAQALRKLGYEAVLVNSNPETVSTDYDTSDRLYLEPLVDAQRARRLRARAARRRRRLLRRPDAAAAGAGARRGRRAAARRPARRDRRGRGPRPLRRRSPASSRRSGAWPRTPTRRARSRTGSATRCSSARTT